MFVPLFTLTQEMFPCMYQLIFWGVEEVEFTTEVTCSDCLEGDFQIPFLFASQTLWPTREWED